MLRLVALAALLGCGPRTVDRVEQLKAPWYAYVETTCTNSHAVLRTPATTWGVCFDDQGNIGATRAAAVEAMQQL